MPLSLLEGRTLAGTTLMNLRGFGPRDIGVLPYGMPAYLAFCTDCIRHLLRR
jgi:hypothetical protein